MHGPMDVKNNLHDCRVEEWPTRSRRDAAIYVWDKLLEQKCCEQHVLHGKG